MGELGLGVEVGVEVGLGVGLDTGEVEAKAAGLPATRGTGVLLEVGLGLGLGLDAGDTPGDVGVDGEDNVGVPAEEGVADGVPAEVGAGVGVGVDGEDEGRAVVGDAAIQVACIQMPGKGVHSTAGHELHEAAYAC